MNVTNELTQQVQQVQYGLNKLHSEFEDFKLITNSRHIELKYELDEVKNEIKEMKVEISEIRSEMKEMKGEISEIRSEMKEMKCEINSLTKAFTTFQGTILQALENISQSKQKPLPL